MAVFSSPSTSAASFLLKANTVFGYAFILPTLVEAEAALALKSDLATISEALRSPITPPNCTRMDDLQLQQKGLQWETGHGEDWEDTWAALPPPEGLLPDTAASLNQSRNI